MTVHAYVGRYADTPDDIGIDKANLVTHWHLWQGAKGYEDADGNWVETSPAEPIDAQTAEPDPWGKGHYPVNFNGMFARTQESRSRHEIYTNFSELDLESGECVPCPGGAPLALEMEVGQQVFNYRDERDRLALQHIGSVVGALGGVDQVYGSGWSTCHAHEDDDYWLYNDLAAYTLIGCPDRLAVSCYGGWRHSWAIDRRLRLERAKRLADAITYKDVRVCGWLSWYDHARLGNMDTDEWRNVCKSAKAVGDHYDMDWMIWSDGGRDRKPYAEAEPYVDIAREVLV